MWWGWCSPCQEHHWKAVDVRFPSLNQEHLKSKFILLLVGWFFSAQLQFCSVKIEANCSFVPLITTCPPPPHSSALHPQLLLFSSTSWFQLKWFEMDVSTQTGLGWFGFSSTELSLDFVIRNEPNPRDVDGLWMLEPAVPSPIPGWGSLMKACAN